jgi:thioesterase domain-containing protein/acyl carrier protein
MVPAAIVPVQEWPLGPNGKLDRDALPAAPPPAAIAMGGELDSELKPLAALWERVLGVPVLEPTADFFALGGHSLNAVSLVLEIERHMGVDVPLAALFEEPTLAGLHQRLQGGGASEHNAVIPLRESGSRPPLFCIQSKARNLLRSTAAEQPVYLVYESLDHTASSDFSVESVAARYLQEVRARVAHGPYRLIGFSVGAQVALEMARQLADAGERVDFLVLADPPLSDAAMFYRQRARLVKQGMAAAGGPVGRLGFLVRQFGMAIKLRARRTRLALLSRYFAWAERSPWYFKGTGLGLLRDRISQPAELVQFRQNQEYQKLYAAYQPKPYSGDTLVLLPESERENSGETGRYWSQFLTGRHHLLLVPGAANHLDLLQTRYMDLIGWQVEQLSAGVWPAAGQLLVGEGADKTSE